MRVAKSHQEQSSPPCRPEGRWCWKEKGRTSLGSWLGRRHLKVSSCSPVTSVDSTNTYGVPTAFQVQKQKCCGWGAQATGQSSASTSTAPPFPGELPALSFSSVKGEGRGGQVPGGVWQEAGGAFDGILGPPTLVPRLKHLAKSAVGDSAPVALEVVAGEDSEAAQPLFHAPGHGVARPPAPTSPAHSRSGRFLLLRSPEGGDGEESRPSLLPR